MKRNKNTFLSGLNVLFLSLVLTMGLASCGGKKPDPDPEPEYPPTEVVSPDPEPGGVLPQSIIPDTLLADVTQWIEIYSGENPPEVEGFFVSHPHALLYSTIANDTVEFYNDRYVAFVNMINEGGTHKVDYYGQQWDDEYEEYYEEVRRKINIVGEGDKFVCYYLTKGYPNGYYAEQSTVFSGKWETDGNTAYVRDFKVAVILLETSGNPDLAPVNSYRVLGDADGISPDTAWMDKRGWLEEEITVSEDDAFRMFRKH